MLYSTLILGILLSAVFFAWPFLGEQRLPIAHVTIGIRVGAAVSLAFCLAVWEVRRRHAVAEIERVHGIRVAEPPSRVAGAVAAVLLGALVVSFGFDQQLFFQALVERNASPRDGAIIFLHRFPATDLIDEAMACLLTGDEYVETAADVFPQLAPELRARASRAVLDRITAEPPEHAGTSLAHFVKAFEGIDHTQAARRLYVDRVIPRLLALPGDRLGEGPRAFLHALAEAPGNPRVGLTVEPQVDVPAAVERLLGRLQRSIETRTPFEVQRRGGEFVPRRVEVRWRALGAGARDAPALEARVTLIAPMPRERPPFDRTYTLDAGADGRAVDRFTEGPLRDLLPP